MRGTGDEAVQYTEEQIIGTLKEQETGVADAELCRKHGTSDAGLQLEQQTRWARGLTRRSHFGRCRKRT
jgi:putative transposase